MFRALTFGEILWDIIEGEPYIGGAPFNLAAHLTRMGGEVSMVSALGDDDLGRRAREKALSFGINTEFVSESTDSPTGTVDVFLDADGHPDYTIHEGTAWDRLAIPEPLLGKLILREWDVICFGTLAQRSSVNRSLLSDILSQATSRHVFYDVNLRQEYYTAEWITDSLAGSTIVKLNDDEVREISSLLYADRIQSPADEEAFVRKMAADYGLDSVLVTRGSGGALVYSGGVFGTTECADVEIADTIGAGDSFGAGFLAAYLCGRTALESARLASRVADFVVSRRGAIPAYTDELAAEIARL
jgi:fructokinase